MNHFDLARAVAVLRSKYKAQPIYVHGNSIEADVFLSLDSKMVLIELAVDDKGINVTNILAAEIRPPLEPIDFQDSTTSYRTNPQVVEFVKKIKQDIGLS